MGFIPYSLRVKSGAPDASDKDLVFFTHTLSGPDPGPCVGEDVLEQLREVLRTDIRPRWIVY
ncbi:hypothetical protein K435DRAFT_781352 [Dendrothele bispora CBS 962.96]|uniref:Uncharacterized protein n=1 Tax=Dendrothele bispora (strain CBS 962.96) TaxID=1314807 RepID=A0A4S8LM39_DENBC|nr:hypothetical protein K435DRAFT_781352 [Dendrothele bispora CBS 962.96]